MSSSIASDDDDAVARSVWMTTRQHHDVMKK